MLILTFSCGVIWGYYGIIVACIETTVGASCAFLIGRYFLRRFVFYEISELQSSVNSTMDQYPKLKFIDRAISEEGWKMVLILRIVPVIPFASLNFLLTVTNVDIVTFFLCTLFGMIPRMSLYVYIGITAGNIPDIIAGNVKLSFGSGRNQMLFYFFGISSLIVGFYTIYRISKKYVDKYEE
jgi:uncharacterized membrane protein YdjX (TVP38/TMEM64 family)